MKKNIKFILLLVFIAIVAGFSGYLMKKNNLNDELVISNPNDISTASLFNANIMDNSGEMISFSKFEGQWLLLNFWATWCAPCREEIPELNEFFHKNNISYADIFKSKIILFPILIKGEKMFLFSG